MITRKLYTKLAQEETKTRFYKHKLSFKILGSLTALGLFIGFKFGKKVANKESNENLLTEFQSEDQIYNILDNEKKPIFLFHYVPGDKFFIKFRQEYLKSVKKYNDKCHFMMINCAKHYNYCRNMQWNRSPKIEMMFPAVNRINENGQQEKFYKNVSYDNDFSQLGIEAFMEDNGLAQREMPTDGIYKYYKQMMFEQINQQVNDE